MKKAKRLYTLYAVLAIFVLLTLLLGIINGVNFTMAAQDADEITRRISGGHGAFSDRSDGAAGADIPAEPPQEAAPQIAQGFAREDFGKGGRLRFMGPDSPELSASVRYFTCVFEGENDDGTMVSFAISAVTSDQALQWAKDLADQKETGWTKTVYRYRVYTENGKTYVTVIDQSRELLPCYRILLISVIGELLGLIVSVLVLIFVSNRLFRPLEEADRKQQRFIAEAESEFKVPLTVINAATETMERQNGASEQTELINRQVKRMTSLVKKLGALAVFDENNDMKTRISVSAAFQSALDAADGSFREKGITLTSLIAPDVYLNADDGAVKKLVGELIDNALKFSRTKAEFTLKKQGERTVITAANDTSLSDRTADQAFDRFTRFENAENVPGAGLGLAYVKDTVRSLDGRVTANVKDGAFTLEIRL